MCALIRALGRGAKLAVPALGIALVAAALTAGLTGADPEANWGPARRQILALGIALLVGSAITVLWPRIDRFLVKVWNATRAAIEGSVRRALRTRPIQGLTRRMGQFLHPLIRTGTPLQRLLSALGARLRTATAARERKVRLLALAVFALAVPVYLWIVSVGYWTHWPPATRYYSDLADAFRNGQVHLLATPDPELLALEDPYDTRQRGEIPFLWDVVLFDGRFYLYWGPVPALLVAGWNTVIPGDVGDSSLVFGFTLATVLFTLLLAGELFLRLFPRLRVRSAIAPLLVAAFAFPLPWLVSGPDIYEASIAAGQAFLMGALYFAARVLLGKGRPLPNLSLAGLFLACAVGSKASLAPASAFWAAVLLAAVAGSRRWTGSRRQRWRSALLFLFPFFLGLAGLGWYNDQRFGSPFEFGARYQLTGMDLNRDYSQAFSPLNIPTNLYTYLFTGVHTADEFPWLRPILGNTRPPPLAWAALHLPGAEAFTPPLYYAEQVTGILYALPFCVFGLIGLGLSLQSLCSPEPPDAGRKTVARVSLALAAGGVAAFVPTLLFVFATARYLADIAPALAVLSALGVWALLTVRSEKAQTTWWVNVLAWTLGLLSIGVSLVLAFQGYSLRFERMNPELYGQILDFLSW
jgi:hypothetical protein